MADQKTTADPRKAAEITDDEINAVVDAVLAKPDTGFYPIGGGDLLDLAAAVEAHEASAEALADPEAKPGWRRAMARPPILVGRPKKEI
ncbi:hypothetical protein [Methylobacterium gregans]|uniref:Uncharacterized protein n=1 Tax=Methylobacterium gregans TaxID=374424 RepID=A0AA37HQ10_9HYPH|nr:hypothetical protein [Methylobacterium gregans]MDQ0521510.1 hypothetical protein [Methylobacterium gregans]GJD79902.1 hypothetical protein NBEOAGPD_3133 [Methylobacterium gregans]GLS54673.1 hypothetical protein GCM10007886_28560 [Methylobacterium gregans]